MTVVGLVRVLEIDGLAFRRPRVAVHVLEQSSRSLRSVLYNHSISCLTLVFSRSLPHGLCHWYSDFASSPPFDIERLEMSSMKGRSASALPPPCCSPF